MKRVIWFLFFSVLLSFSLLAEGNYDETANKTKMIAKESAATAFTQIPIPAMQYFVERKTVAEWYKRWDKPSVITYVYLVSYGNVIGYYVCNGKPASTGSFLNPEYIQDYDSNGGVVEKQQQDLDGTFGSNNPGIRFFTAEGTAVEWAGSGASYIYSDAPLPLNVPKLNVSKKN
jgi:hypothetical protein